MAKIFIDTEFLEGAQTKRFIGIPFGKTKPTIDLISIGLVDDTGKEYYGISKEFNLKEAWDRYDLERNPHVGDRINAHDLRIYWIRKNVLKPIFKELVAREWETQEKAERLGIGYTPICDRLEFTYRNLKKLIKKYGLTRTQLKHEVCEFICSFQQASEWAGHDFLDYGFKTYVENNPPEFYAYYADYDWVAFCWLFGYMKDLPSGFPMYCKDLKQELDRVAASKDWYYGRDIWSNTRKSGEDDLSDGDRPASLQEKIEKLKRHDEYPKQSNEHDALSDARWNRELYNFLQKIKTDK